MNAITPAPQLVNDTIQQRNNRNFYLALLELQGEEIDVTATSANTDITVNHGLGRVPRNVVVLITEQQGTNYIEVRPGSVAWTNKQITIQCSKNSVTFRIRVT